MDHASLPVRLPDLSHLTNEQLGALRGKLAPMMRETRKKATSVITRIPSVQKAWLRTLSLKSDDPERASILAVLELELLRHPEAFLTYALANSLVALDEGLKAEMTQRQMLTPKKGKKAAPTLPPKVPTIPGEEPDVLTMMQVLDDESG